MFHEGFLFCPMWTITHYSKPCLWSIVLSSYKASRTPQPAPTLTSPSSLHHLFTGKITPPSFPPCLHTGYWWPFTSNPKFLCWCSSGYHTCSICRLWYLPACAVCCVTISQLALYSLRIIASPKPWLFCLLLPNSKMSFQIQLGQQNYSASSIGKKAPLTRIALFSISSLCTCYFSCFYLLQGFICSMSLFFQISGIFYLSSIILICQPLSVVML